MNATETKTVSLIDYANAREDVVLFWTSVGVPMGDYSVLGNYDLDFADRNGLLELSGTVDSSDDWNWDGAGRPTDDQRNRISQLNAYIDTAKWDSIVQEFLEEG